ncbi:hypothetical protein HYX13_05945, partial [Candidatus Woesearchaeota archaeon]|nr:hypothetical protein [Candidatus Woesearchaeota archaeon]
FFHQHFSVPHFFALENWVLENKTDDVAYFLNEAGANALHYSTHKVPAKMQLWLGKKGFVIGIEQQGKGFDVELACKKYDSEPEKREKYDVLNKQKEASCTYEKEGGKGFAFFKNCRNAVFFDEVKEARTVFLQFLF